VAVAVTADGRFVVTGSWDGSARIWEIATGRLLARFWGNRSFVTDVDVDATGRLVVSAGVDFAGRLYDCVVCGTLDQLLAYSYARFPRTLTPGERATYLHEKGSAR
jgi:WD40 repeat protein